jgi:N-acetylglucosamine kinase-like BadF-type ATPase
VGVILGVDGGNSKTELLAVSDDGELLALLRGPGSNSHAIGADGVAAVIARLVAQAGVALPADQGAFFLCGADVPADVEELRREVERGAWVRRALVDNDTFALLHAGTDRADAVAVVCGAGLNCVGRRVDGRVARYPALGWETGDWGGADAVGREALFFAARAEDARGDPTVLVEIVRRHFGAERVEEVGADIHYKRLPEARLGELAPLVLEAAAAGDASAEQIVDRLVGEIVLFVERALRDLELDEADVVLGGGMFQLELFERVAQRLPAGVTPVRLQDPPVLGAAFAALDAAGATVGAKQRLREELRAR